MEGDGNYDEVKGIKFIVYVSIIRSQCRCSACLLVPLVSAKVAGVEKRVLRFNYVRIVNLVGQHLASMVKEFP